MLFTFLKFKMDHLFYTILAVGFLVNTALLSLFLYARGDGPLLTIFCQLTDKGKFLFLVYQEHFKDSKNLISG